VSQSWTSVSVLVPRVALVVEKWLPVARVYRNGRGSVRRVAATYPDEGCVYRSCSALPSPTPVSGRTGTNRYRVGDLSAGFADAVWTTSRGVTWMSRPSGPSAIPPRAPVASAFEMQMGPSMSRPEDHGICRWCAASVGRQILDRIRQMSSTIGLRGTVPHRCFRIPALSLPLHYTPLHCTRATESPFYTACPALRFRVGKAQVACLVS